MKEPQVKIKGEKQAISQYLFYYHEIMKGMKVKAIEAKSLLELAMVFGGMAKAIPDMEIEQVIAAKAIQAIKDDKYPPLKYDSDKDAIYRVLQGQQDQEQEGHI